MKKSKKENKETNRQTIKGQGKKVYLSQESTFVNFYAHTRPCITYIYLVCKSVGVADRNRIPDARMTASSFHSTYYYPYYGRPHENRGRGAWCAKTNSVGTEYLQVDLGTVLDVCALATQGNQKVGQRTTTYKVHMSTDGINWNTYKEQSIEKVWKE